MRTTRTGLALATLAAFTAIGATGFAGDAEAKGKSRKSVTVIIGGGGYGYGGYGYGPGYAYSNTGYNCGWLWHRYQKTGLKKWRHRWHQCKYGW